MSKMEINSVSLNGDDENSHGNSHSSNYNELNTDKDTISSSSPSLSIHPDTMNNINNDTNNYNKRTNDTDRTDDDNDILNIPDIELNGIIEEKNDDLSIVAGPLKKKYKKSSDNLTDNTVEINDNVVASCSTSITPKCSSKIKNRRYRKHSSGNDDSDDDGDNNAVKYDKNNVEENEIPNDFEENSVDPLDRSPDPETNATRNSSIDTDDNAQSDSDQDDRQSHSSEKVNDSSEWTTASEDESDVGVPAVLKKIKPKPQWFVLSQLMNRQIGNNKNFDRDYYGSLHVVQRMKLLYKMNAHEGCVNALCFNERGNYLASASDDLKVAVWDWAKNKKKYMFTSGHRLNIFDVKWLPVDFESLIVTCARDGHVRVIDTRTSSNRRLTSHRREARGLAVHPDYAHAILSVGDDGKVLSIDIRVEKHTRLLTVKDRSSYIPLYTIDINPRNSNEFCVGGRSRTVEIYDRRRIVKPIYSLCPHNLRENLLAYVTSAVYNYNGTELLASYSDDDIYLFDTAVPHPRGDYAHHYDGHRNSVTVKGVNFFGPKSEFIVSGSDCAHIFIWDKNTEAIVQWMLGDNQGVVNRLESHPHAPILATSGLDSDVKIWIPSHKREPTMPDLESCIKSNMLNRYTGGLRPDVFDSRVVSVFFHHVRQYGLYRGQSQMSDRILRRHHYDDISESSNESVSSNNNDDDSTLDDDTEVAQCSPS